MQHFANWHFETLLLLLWVFFCGLVNYCYFFFVTYYICPVAIKCCIKNCGTPILPLYNKFSLNMDEHNFSYLRTKSKKINMNLSIEYVYVCVCVFFFASNISYFLFLWLKIMSTLDWIRRHKFDIKLTPVTFKIDFISSTIRYRIFFVYFFWLVCWVVANVVVVINCIEFQEFFFSLLVILLVSFSMFMLFYLYGYVCVYSSQSQCQPRLISNWHQKYIFKKKVFFIYFVN